MIALAWVWGFACLVTASVCLWPWVNRWFADPDQPEWRVMRWPLVIGLSLGCLTLWMLAIGFWQLNGWVVLAFPILSLGFSFFSPQSSQRTRGNTLSISAGAVFSMVKRIMLRLRTAEPTAWTMLAGLGLLAVVLAQATYYPFTGDDEISRYAYYARLLFVNGRITEAVRGYPMFMPMAYAFVFFVIGQPAEQLARLVPVLLSAMTVVATGALGYRWYGARGGWAAAFALAICPLYLRWSPNGYVDIPSALYFVLCAYAGDVWLTNRKLRWAALAGVLAGLAMWTKQAGFAGLACLGLVFAWALVHAGWRGGRTEAIRAARAGVIALGLATLAGGLWYLRNAYYDGWANAVPGPGVFYYQQARSELSTVIPFVGYFDVFGAIPSLLYLSGLLWSAARLKRAIWLLVWIAPYTLLWWRLFSYDARFLLTVLPFFASLFGGLVAEVRWPSAHWLKWGTTLVIVSAAGLGIYGSELGGLRRWIVAPTATYAERLYRAKGDLYPTVEFIRDHVPPSARIVSMDGRLTYYLIDRPIAVSYPARLSDLESYDYFVVGSWWASTYAGLGNSAGDVPRELADPHRLEQVYSAPGGGLIVYYIPQP